MNEKLVCAISGHRFSALPFKSNEADPRCISLKTIIRNELIELIEHKNVGTFLCGMALGSDQIVAEIILQLKHEYPYLKLIAYVPCREQYQKWSEAQLARYQAILQHTDEIICLSEKYTRGCMQKRNRSMVDAANILFAVYTPEKTGGTASTVQYAKKMEIPVFAVDPLKC